MELRKDYILDRWVILATNRAKRPHDFKQAAEAEKKDSCVFCPGNEDKTPPEIGRFPQDWRLRWFPNKFAAVEDKGNATIRKDNGFFTFADAFGYHEVIVETNDHSKQLADLPKKDVAKLFEVYRERIEELDKRDNIEYVQVFKNHGRKAGTSLVHSHSQIIAYNKLPKTVRDELAAVREHDECPYCKIMHIEKNSDRRVYENDTWIAFTPYASRFAFELWFFPKRHFSHEPDDAELEGIAQLLLKALAKLKELNAPYNYYLHYARDEQYHFHVELIPRLNTFAGFEHATGDIINTISPEMAAEFYRE